MVGVGCAAASPVWFSPGVLRVLSHIWGDSFTMQVCGAGAMGQGEDPAGPRPPQSLPQFTQLSAGPSRAPQSPWSSDRLGWRSSSSLAISPPPQGGVAAHLGSRVWK